MKKGKLILVGAGPGDPELITLKGVKAIQQADVILYDALANEQILEHAQPEVKKIFVGKRAGKHLFIQQQINELIEEQLIAGKKVLRLKGGDPFVFGRGYEEVQVAHKVGAEVQVIPGVSSVVAVPGLQGIPLTHRGHSDSFWVLTGATKDGEVSDDLKQAVQSDATIVILMGLMNLDKIVQLFQDYNKGSLPAAIIQQASLPSEHAVFGTVEELPKLVEANKIKPPATMVIGKVVGLNER